MNRKPLLVALGAAALASVLFATVSLAATGSKATAGTTMHLIEHDVSFNFVPAAPGPPGRATTPSQGTSPPSPTT
jgi:hypothetical protein